MKECTGKEITLAMRLYHLGVPVDQISDMAGEKQCCLRSDYDASYITALLCPAPGDRPDVIPDGCVNFAFLGQFAETPRVCFYHRVFCALPLWAVYGLLGVNRGVPEVWGSVCDIKPDFWTAV